MTRRNNPFDEIERMFERMQRQFEGELDAPAALGGGDIAVDVADRGDEYAVIADLPGYDRADVSVELTDDALEIAAEHTEESETADDEFVRRERHHQSLSRSVSIPGPVAADGAEATFSNGVLTVTLPKASGEDSHRIDID